LEKLKEPMAVWNTVNLTDIKPDRFDAEYFRKDYQDNLSYLKTTGDTCNLGRLFNHINRGSQPLYSDNGTIKALRSVNVGFMNFNETRQEYVTDSFFETNNRGQVQKKDVLITSTGVGTLGRTSVWFYNDKAYCDGHITILRNGSVDPYFITAFLNSKYGLLQFDQNFRGSSGQIEIYPYDISKFVIPECLFPYQQEIGDYLRKAFELQQESQSLYQKATDLLETELGLDKITFEKPKSYTASFSDLVINRRIDSDFYNPDYEMLKSHLKTLNGEKLRNISFLRSGFAFSSSKYKTEGSQIVRIQNISGNLLNLKRNPVFYSDSDLVSLSNFKIRKGDTLMAMTGNTIGNCSLNTSDSDLYLNQRVLAITPDENYVTPEYLNLILRNTVFKTFIDRELVGGAQPNISLEFIGNQIVPIVNEDSMEIITNNLKKHYANSEKSKKLLAKAKMRVEELIEEAAKK
jgi:type I restriction enzyme S subunit